MTTLLVGLGGYGWLVLAPGMPIAGSVLGRFRAMKYIV
jgi:hypothetical protein